MFYVYLLENIRDKSWYTGFTSNLKRRFQEHLGGNGSKTTSLKKGEYKIIYYEAYLNKLDALGREKYLKSGSGRKYLKKQLKNYFEERDF